jgi:hypothetical protein
MVHRNLRSWESISDASVVKNYDGIVTAVSTAGELVERSLDFNYQHALVHDLREARICHDVQASRSTLAPTTPKLQAVLCCSTTSPPSSTRSRPASRPPMPQL